MFYLAIQTFHDKTFVVFISCSYNITIDMQGDTAVNVIRGTYDVQTSKIKSQKFYSKQNTSKVSALKIFWLAIWYINVMQSHA